MSYAVALRSGPVFDHPIYRYLSTADSRDDAAAIRDAANEVAVKHTNAVVLEVVPPGDVGAGEYVTLVTDAGENIVCRV